MSILVVGSVALDTIKTPLGQVEKVLGGSATYFSISASFFSPVNLLAVVGSDFPFSYLELLRDKRVNLAGLKIKKGKTFSWIGEYGWDFNTPRTISTCLNVFSDFDPQVLPEYKDSEFLFLANIDPDIQEKVLRQLKKVKLTACDTMNYWIENKRESLLRLLKRVDIFLLNESEAKELTREINLVKAAKAIIGFGPKWVIIKKGEHGALLFSQESFFSTPAFLLESVVDPTGAGDTFAGGVVGYLATSLKINETNLRKAIVYGSVMATFAVEDFGLKRLISVTHKDIAVRFKKFKEFTHF